MNRLTTSHWPLGPMVAVVVAAVLMMAVFSESREDKIHKLRVAFETANDHQVTGQQPYVDTSNRFLLSLSHDSEEVLRVAYQGRVLFDVTSFDDIHSAVLKSNGEVHIKFFSARLGRSEERRLYSTTIGCPIVDRCKRLHAALLPFTDK